MEGLTEGRIVHFCIPAAPHRAAIVANVVDKEAGIVDLFVFSMPQDGHGGFFMQLGATYSAEPQDNTWHWIERA